MAGDVVTSTCTGIVKGYRFGRGDWIVAERLQFNSTIDVDRTGYGSAVGCCRAVAICTADIGSCQVDRVIRDQASLRVTAVAVESRTSTGCSPERRSNGVALAISVAVGGTSAGTGNEAGLVGFGAGEVLHGVDVVAKGIDSRVVADSRSVAVDAAEAAAGRAAVDVGIVLAGEGGCAGSVSVAAVAAEVDTGEPVVGTHAVEDALAVGVAVDRVAAAGGELQVIAGDAAAEGRGVVDQTVGMVGLVQVRSAVGMTVVTGKNLADLRVDRQAQVGKVRTGEGPLAGGGGTGGVTTVAAKGDGGGLVEPLGAGQVAEVVGGAGLAAGLGITMAVDIAAGIVDRAGCTRGMAIQCVGRGGIAGFCHTAEGNVDLDVHVLGDIGNGGVVGNGCGVADGAAVGVLTNHVFLVAAGGHVVVEAGGAVAAVAAVAVDRRAAPGRHSFDLERSGGGRTVAVAVQVATVSTGEGAVNVVGIELDIRGGIHVNGGTGLEGRAVGSGIGMAVTAVEG